MTVRLEFLVEPFVEGRPGAHVRAAIAAAESRGLDVEVGAFGNVVVADEEEIGPLIDAVWSAAHTAGATRVTFQAITGDAGPSVHVGGLQSALGQLIDQVERELGTDLGGLDREARQVAVRLLDERGAFLLRKAIDDVADAMGVSRITIYNYLNAIRSD